MSQPNVKRHVAAHDMALEKARTDFLSKQPDVMAAAAAAQFDPQSNTITIPYLGRPYTVNCVSADVTPAGHDVELSVIEHAVILHNLITATGRALSGNLVSYREFRKVGASGNNGLECDDIGAFYRIYGDKPELLYKVLDVLPGERVKNGDAAVRIDILPRVPVVFVLWASEEGIPAEITALYDAYALDYLSLEDLAGVASFTIDYFVALYGRNFEV